MIIKATPTRMGGVKTTPRELMHYGYWGKYCKLMHVENGYEDIDEEIYLPEELLELMGV